MDLDRLLSHERMFDRAGRRNDPSLWSASSSHGMVATAHYLATKAGAEVLARGGNAVDAAVTASLALAVCESAGSGLGGMAMMLIHEASTRRTVLVEGACRAPVRATVAEVAGADRNRGYRAIAVPTHLAVLQRALASYGTLEARQVLAPAIEIAEEGFPLTQLQHFNIVQSADAIRSSSAAPFFFDDDGEPWSEGRNFRQPALGRTLQRLATAGLDDFYRGEIAREICRDMRENGGFIEEADLRADLYRETSPIETAFGDELVRTVGPPGGGLALLQMLNLLSWMPESVDLDTPDGAVITAAIIRQARRDRRKYRLKTKANELGEGVELLSSDYAEHAVEQILEELSDARKSGSAKPAPDLGELAPGETSHIVTMDVAGNVVSLTQSVERSFGAAVVTGSLGFVYNGYLRAFKIQNQQHPHYLQPGAPARSNAAPTIVFRDGEPVATLGSTGSERMASGIFQVLMRLRNQSPFESVHAPRLHCTPESQVLLEEERFSRECLDALTQYGCSLEPLDPYSFKMGGLQLVARRGKSFIGVADPRRDGAAAGPETNPLER